MHAKVPKKTRTPQKKSHITILFLFIACVVLLLPHLAGAATGAVSGAGTPRGSWNLGEPINILGGALGWIVAKIGYIIGYALGIIVAWEAKLISWAIDPNTFLFTRAPAVQIGWEITRNLVNLGFVLSLIIIAIGTILRLESYGMRRTLWRLIVAAILVNFSLVIAGLFIDASNLVTHFFVTNSVEGGMNNYSKMFARGFNVMGLLEARQGFNSSDITKSAKTFGWGLMMVVASVLFFVVFSLVAMIVLGALFLILLIRILFIWILLILSPFAWLFWIFPKGPGIPSAFSWDGWWKEFLRWTLFAPVVSFFLYVAFQIVGTLGKQSVGGGILASLPTTGLGLLESTSAPAWILQFILFVGLLIGGMWAANEMSITGAKTALNVATSAARWPQREFARSGQRALAGPGLIGGAARKLESWTAGRPIVGGVADLIGKTRGSVEKRIQDQAKVVENLSDEALVAMIKGRGRMPENALGIIDVLDKRGALGKVPKDVLGRWLLMAERFGREKKILNVRPTLAPLVNKDTGETARSIPAKKITDVPTEEFFANQVALSTREGKIKNLLGDPGSKDQLNALLLGLQTAAPSVLRDALLKALTQPKSPIAQARYDPATGKFIA